MNDDKVLIGLDMGGSLNKIIVISSYRIEFQGLSQYSQITLNHKQMYLYTALFSQIKVFLQSLKKKIEEKTTDISVGITGCGGVKHKQIIHNVFQKYQYINQFQANPRGLDLYGKMGMKVDLHLFSNPQKSKVQYSKLQNQSFSDIDSNFMFVSLGSGVNFQKFGKGQNCIERKKVEDPSTSYDGYSMLGTCLGSSYLFGLINSLNGQKDPQKIAKSLIQDESTKEIYDMVIVNLMQHSLSLSILHKLDYILISGSILKLKEYIHQQFLQALELNHYLPLKRTLIQLNSLTGFIGALGTVHKYI